MANITDKTMVDASICEQGAIRDPQKQFCGFRERDDGFTLLELLVVILILGMLVSFVAPQAMKTLANARTSVAKEEITEFDSYLERFVLDAGRYPSTEEGLAALSERPPEAENWSGPYIKGSVGQKDPWGHPWIFRSPSMRAGQRNYDLCSAGPSGKGKEPGDEMTICNL